VTRTLGAVVLAAIALAGMTARTTATSEASSGTAGASECTWERHSKRVVKRVRRHGRVRRFVRLKHWWTCEPSAAAPVAAVPIDPAPTPPAPSEPAPEPEPEANRLSARASEYYWILSRPTVEAGTVTVELNNQGEDPHNLNLQREGDGGEPLRIPETDSLQRNVASFDLPAGKYRLWCSLPEHEEKGMHTTLTVE
jgi:plastocyanin